ncbi:DUF4832 domain-containing protein [Brevibacillus fortis]|uniref:DUF4832 domain-containing protein n=1 Tax=Brevibacillus fortis TaxID=2126352 RepID=A0A2P7UR07_9BACL|nr:DUF4832 domain-containing protein [Brevibacillus fortis]PSJ89369.1 hypothetical protein C7R93_23020 [Brevibacillus fortis]
MKSKLFSLCMAILLTAISMLSSSAVASSYATVTYYPKPTQDVLRNPYMGLAPSSRSNSIEQEHTLVHANITWRMLEPAKGEYDFEKVEDYIRFEEWGEKDVKFIIRLVLDDPDDEEADMEIPDWLYEELDGDGEWYENGHGKGFSPNYSNPELIMYHRKLIHALGERYKDDPRIAFIQLGSIGHWGEWHTNTSIPFPKLKISDQYVQPYLENFPDNMLLMRRPHPIAGKYRMGLYNDVFGNKEDTKSYISWIQEGYVSWLTKEKMPAMPDFWKYASSGGEFSPDESLSNYFKRPLISQVISQAKSTHISWVGPNTPGRFPKDSENQKYVDRFLNTIGYRFSLIKETHRETVKAGDDLSVSMDWQNQGVAPFYFPWILELSLADEDGNIVAHTKTDEDIRKWLPGRKYVKQDLEVPADLPEGDYTLSVAILDPSTGEPGIEFAMEGKRDDGRYTLGTVQVRE